MKLKFRSKLERLASGIEYFAIPVPRTVSIKIGIKAAIPVIASVNGSSPFKVSLHPVGQGLHKMRVKQQIRKEVDLSEGCSVNVVIEVIDPKNKEDLPDDLARALKQADLSQAFEEIPPGARRYLLRKIEEAARPETRIKRIDEALGAAEKRS